MRLTILLTFFIAVSCTAMGQHSLQGRWYMFSRNRVIEFDISKKLLVSRQLNWGLTTEGFNDEKPDSQLIAHVTEENKNIYFYLNNVRDTDDEVTLNTFKIIRPGKEITWVLNGIRKSFSDTGLIRPFIINDTNKKYGMTLYSAKEINRLKGQKNINQMTAKDFKTYASKILQFRARMDSLSNLPDASNNDLLYYAYSMIRVLAGDTGYNPLMTNKDYEELIKRFENNPATKATVKKLME